MNYTKIFGWSLLIAGVIIIGWSLFSAFNVFTAKSPVPEIFAKQKSADIQKGKSSSSDPQAQLENMIGEQLKNMLPADTLPKLLDMTVYSMLIFLLFSGGGKVSELGIKMIKS